MVKEKGGFFHYSEAFKASLPVLSRSPIHLGCKCVRALVRHNKGVFKTFFKTSVQ
jgi:hypothetical protein